MVNVVGGKMSMGFGDDADFLKQIETVLQLANAITRGLVLAWVMVGIALVALVLLIIYLAVHIM